MSDIFHIVGVGMGESQQRMQAISANAAGAALPGYRRHVVSGNAFAAALAGGNADPGIAEHLDAGPAAVAARFGVNLQPAAAKASGRALDVFIDAPDLFFALTDGEQTWLTRAGSFQVSAAGVLLGEQGLSVVGADGDVLLPAGDVEIADDGRITHRGALVGALQLFRSNDPAALVAGPGSLLLSPTGVEPVAAGVGRVRSGMLEASNTDAAREMLELIAVSRQFEALSRVAQGYDQMLGRAIQRLGGG